MKEKDPNQNENLLKKDSPPSKAPAEKQQTQKTEVKNANAAGQGAIGRTGEKPGPGMKEEMNY